jgi:hypothetical protein
MVVAVATDSIPTRSIHMEDWQQWQIQADEVAAGLNADVDGLERDFFGESVDATFRAFWPRFRELKERVRIAPAIKLDDKLALERRLRGLGSRAYKAQEATYAQSGERKSALLESIRELKARAESMDQPRALRELRREFDSVRALFDNSQGLVPSDRQAVWDAWREGNQFIWQRLTDLWNANEVVLRDILATARQQAEAGNANAARQSIGQFYDTLRTHEAKQTSINGLKAEAEGIRRSAEEHEVRKVAERVAAPPRASMAPLDVWRGEVDRNRETIARLRSEVEELDRQFQNCSSILEQAMIRGTLVEKRQKLSEVERSKRVLEQRIDQSEEAPVLSIG